jgi:hypothetical protein
VLVFTSQVAHSQLVYEYDSLQAESHKNLCIQLKVKSISKYRVLYAKGKPGKPVLITREVYSVNSDSIQRFQNGRKQVTIVKNRTGNLYSTGYILPDGRESFRTDTYCTGRYTDSVFAIKFLKDTLQAVRFRYYHGNLPAYIQTDEPGGIKNIVRYAYDTLGPDTLQTRIWENGVLTATILNITDTVSLKVYSVFVTLKNGIRQKTEYHWHQHHLKDEFIFDHRGDSLTSVWIQLSPDGKETFRKIKDHEFNTTHLLLTLYDRKGRKCGQIGFGENNREKPDLNWRIKYNRKNREKEMTRLDFNSKVVYRERSSYYRNGLLSRKVFYGSDGKPYLEEFYKVEK